MKQDDRLDTFYCIWCGKVIDSTKTPIHALEIGDDLCLFLCPACAEEGELDEFLQDVEEAACE